jgi:hypothetical protein
MCELSFFILFGGGFWRWRFGGGGEEDNSFRADLWFMGALL